MIRLIGLLHYPAGLAALGLTALFLVCRPPPSRYVRVIAIACLLFFLVEVVVTGMTPPDGTFDFTAFWKAGLTVIEGGDPVDGISADPLPVLNPPTAYPFFSLLGAFSPSTAYFLWTCVSASACLLLAVLSTRLASEDGILDRELALVLAATVALSNATRASLTSGQLGIAIAFALLCAVQARRKGRSVLAGMALTFATIKPATMMPFLLLFRRRKDVVAWAVLLLASLGLCLSVGEPSRLPERLKTILKQIGKHGEAGGLNDFSYAVPDNGDMIGYDHAFYRTGVRDRPAVRFLEYTTLAAMSAGLVYLFQRGTLNDRSEVALAAMFASVFLYHRLSDTVILTIPLAYVLARSRSTSERARLAYAGAGFLMLAVLFMQRGLMKGLRDVASDPGLLPRLLEVFIAPYATWSISLAMILLIAAESYSGKADR